jgi:hypothetical protein
VCIDGVKYTNGQNYVKAKVPQAQRRAPLYPQAPLPRDADPPTLFHLPSLIRAPRPPSHLPTLRQSRAEGCTRLLRTLRSGSLKHREVHARHIVGCCVCGVVCQGGVFQIISWTELALHRMPDGARPRTKCGNFFILGVFLSKGFGT